MATLVYLNGDLLSFMGPVDVPGIQPCPLCTRQCVGSANDRAPCADGSDCNSSNCSGTSCLGGPVSNNGKLCAPETSGPGVLGAAFPTSHDCTLDPMQMIKGIGAKGSFSFDLTTGMAELNAKDLINQRRVFCGFCRNDNTTDVIRVLSRRT